MVANPQLDGSVLTVTRFQACAADLQRTTAHLRAIETEMADTVQDMRFCGASRERLTVAEDILADLRAALSELGGIHMVQSRAPGERQTIGL